MLRGRTNVSFTTLSSLLIFFTTSLFYFLSYLQLCFFSFMRIKTSKQIFGSNTKKRYLAFINTYPAEIANKDKAFTKLFFDRRRWKFRLYIELHLMKPRKLNLGRVVIFLTNNFYCIKNCLNINHVTTYRAQCLV